MVIAFVLAFAMNVGSYWFSDKIVLSMYGAQPVDEAQRPGSTASSASWLPKQRSRYRHLHDPGRIS
jgi:Zn-dependent protease with chaperone function